jgi:hypothetical protein
MKVWMKYLILGAFALVCAIALNASAGHASAANLTWVGTASGHTHEPTAWNPAQAPQAGDNLTFNGGNIDPYYMEAIALGKITYTTGWYKSTTIMASGVTATTVTIAGGAFNQNSNSLHCTWLTITNGSLAMNGGFQFSSLAANQWYRFVTTDNLHGVNAISDRQASGAGVITINAGAWGTMTKFAMSEFPLITSTPITTGTIAHTYSYDANASEAVTWTVTTSYSGLDIDSSGIVSGFLSTDALNVSGGSITVNIVATDAVGAMAYQNYTISVTGLSEDLLPITQALLPVIVGVLVLGVAVSAFGATGLKKGKKKG